MLLVDRSLSFGTLTGIRVLSHQLQELGDRQPSFSISRLHGKHGPRGLSLILALVPVLVLKHTSLEGKPLLMFDSGRTFEKKEKPQSLFESCC